jgi:hypothetical protein
MFATFILILLFVLSAMSFLPRMQRLVTNALGITSNDGNDAGSSGQGSNSSSHGSSSQQNTGPHALRPGYQPSALDVVVVKAMLTKGLALPNEIVLSLLDHAEYWPHTCTILDRSLTVTSGEGHEDQFIVSITPCPRGQTPPSTG